MEESNKWEMKKLRSALQELTVKGSVPGLISRILLILSLRFAEGVCGSGSRVKLLEKTVYYQYWRYFQVFQLKLREKAGRHSCNIPGNIHLKNHWR